MLPRNHRRHCRSLRVPDGARGNHKKAVRYSRLRIENALKEKPTLRFYRSAYHSAPRMEGTIPHKSIMKIEKDLKRIKRLTRREEDANWDFRCFLKTSELSEHEINPKSRQRLVGDMVGVRIFESDTAKRALLTHECADRCEARSSRKQKKYSDSNEFGGQLNCLWKFS